MMSQCSSRHRCRPTPSARCSGLRLGDTGALSAQTPGFHPPPAPQVRTQASRMQSVGVTLSGPSGPRQDQAHQHQTSDNTKAQPVINRH